MSEKQQVINAYEQFLKTLQKLGWKQFDIYAKTKRECYDFSFVQRLCSPILYAKLDALEVNKDLYKYSLQIDNFYKENINDWVDIDTYLDL